MLIHFVVDNKILYHLLAFLAVGEGRIVFLFLFLNFLRSFLFFLELGLVATTLSFTSNSYKVVAHGGHHLSNFFLVGAEQFVHFCFFFFDEVHAVVGTGGEEMSYFGSVFAAIQMEDEFLFGEGVCGVERTTRHFIILLLLEHSYQIIYSVYISVILFTSFIEMK